MVLYICYIIKGVPYMNDLLNNNIKPKNTKELFEFILMIVTETYNKIISDSIKYRKNKATAKMSDPEIISIYLLIECKGKSINSGYSSLKADFPNLVNYVERSRFNRLVNSLMTVIRAIRRELKKDNNSKYKIVDSFPLINNKFGRAYFGKRLRDISSYGYCASKKETYYGMKVHVITDLNGNPIDYVLTKANVDDRDVLFELSNLVNIDILFGDKGYVGNVSEELKKEKNIKLYALKRNNSKDPLPKNFRNMISKLRRRIETIFYQLNECFNIKRVRSNSKIGLQTSLEIKLLCFNIISLIGGHTRISEIINFN